MVWNRVFCFSKEIRGKLYEKAMLVFDTRQEAIKMCPLVNA